MLLSNLSKVVPEKVIAKNRVSPVHLFIFNVYYSTSIRYIDLVAELLTLMSFFCSFLLWKHQRLELIQGNRELYWTSSYLHCVSTDSQLKSRRGIVSSTCYEFCRIFHSPSSGEYTARTAELTGKISFAIYLFSKRTYVILRRICRIWLHPLLEAEMLDITFQQCNFDDKLCFIILGYNHTMYRKQTVKILKRQFIPCLWDLQ